LKKVELTASIVLNRFKYNDKNDIVLLYTTTRGALSILHPVSKRNKINLFQPLTILDVVIVYNSKFNFHKVIEVTPRYIPYNCFMHPFKSHVSLVMQEIMTMILKSASCEIDLFLFLEKTIKELNDLNNVTNKFVLRFLIDMMRHLGIYPHVETYKDGYRFNMNEGVFCNQIIGDNIIDERTSRLLHIEFSEGNVEDILDINILIKTIINFYKIHLIGVKEINSLKLL